VSWQTSSPRLRVVDAADLEERYVTCLAEIATELLANEGLAWSDIRVVLPPQISSSFIGRLAWSLGVPRSRCVDAAAKDADLFTSSLPYALREFHERGSAEPGDIGLLLAVGAGIVVGAALYHF
jgi:3-oxoacyl-[acyl-carrier-protein] synthase III